MKYLWLIIFLFGNSYQINSDILYNNDKDSRQNDWPINDTNGTENLAAGSRNYSREERSNFLTVLKNPNVQSHLQKTNPNLLHYFSHKDNHVFTDIMRKISSATANNTNNQAEPIPINAKIDPFKRNFVKKSPEYEVSSELYEEPSSNDKNKTSFETIHPKDYYDNNHSHEISNNDQNDQLLKLATVKELISTSNDMKNSDKYPMQYKESQYVPADNGNFQEYLSCCDHLFNKYGPKIQNVQDEVFIVPNNEEYSHFQFPIHTQNPPISTLRYPPKPVSFLRNYQSLFNRDPKLPLVNKIKELPHKEKFLNYECIENHGIDANGAVGGHFVPVHVEGPEIMQEHIVQSNQMNDSPNGHLVPINFKSPNLIPEHLLSYQMNKSPNGHLFPAHRIDGFESFEGQHLAPSVNGNLPPLKGLNTFVPSYINNHMSATIYHPKPSPPSSVWTKKLALLGKKYFLG